jgi:hypothetical protein
MARDIKGRFAIGHPGGPGRPKRQTEAAYLGAMMAACPLEEWQAIVGRAVTDAKGGDAKAREWLGRYLVGDPATKAPAPLQVVVQQLLQADEALETAAHKLAAPVLSSYCFPPLQAEEDLKAALEAEAAAAILAHGEC